jgi:glycosyltransferase involved in cell wall biosynthesis
MARVVFLDRFAGGFCLDTGARSPLGGAQSALCGLAAQLAGLGHDVFVLNRRHDVVDRGGVVFMPLSDDPWSDCRALAPDVCVFNDIADRGHEARRALASTPLILWRHTAPHFEGADSVFRSPFRDFPFDSVVFVSHWQRTTLLNLWDFAEDKAVTIYNGLSPVFRFSEQAPGALVADKTNPYSLAYTSTPFRGLDLLMETVEEHLGDLPGLSVDVFSGMGVYRGDDTDFLPLYRRIAAHGAMRHHGSVGQEALSRALLGISILAYPNTYPETFCLSAIEAMASGCLVVSGAHGALPEVTGGFARLVPLPMGGTAAGREAGKRDFAAALVAAARDLAQGGEAVGRHLAAQIAFCRQTYDWAVLARQWDDHFKKF